MQASRSSANRPITDGLNTDLHLSLEKVDKFCYLGDMLDADVGCDSEITTGVRSAWKKFRFHSNWKGFSLKLKGRYMLFV